MTESLAVVITGSTQGLGLAYAREFLRRGHRVVVSGRSADRVATAEHELQSGVGDRGKVVGVPCDTSRLHDVERLWAAAVQAFGRIDIWINNAGYARTGSAFAAVTPDELSLMVDTNLVGTLHATQVAYAGLRKQGAGKLFNTLGGGAMGQVVPGMAAYSTTKRGVWYLTKSLRKEAKGSGVVVGMLSPGMNVTEGMERELARLGPVERKRAVRVINMLGDRVDTTVPWLVERMLSADAKRPDIRWLTGGKMLARSLSALVRRREVLAS